jgi:FixJ family two-component response regulator
VDFLTKPFRDQSLLEAVAAGIEQDQAQRARELGVREQARRHATLTTRERQVLHRVVKGRLNKQIAFELGISEVTVKLHRSGAMKKMQAGSVGELIRAWDMLPTELREERT